MLRDSYNVQDFTLFVGGRLHGQYMEVPSCVRAIVMDGTLYKRVHMRVGGLGYESEFHVRDGSVTWEHLRQHIQRRQRV